LPTVLLFAGDTVLRQLEKSPVWRDDLERVVARTSAEAIAQAASQRPRLIVVDSALPSAEQVVRQLRSNAETRVCSIVAAADGETWGAELGLLDAGANAVLRLPPGPEWDQRIQGLLSVPTRKETRIDANLTLRGEAANEEVRARVVNLSSTGMLLQTAVALKLGADLRFALELPGFETSTGEVTGEARIVRLAGPGCYGAQFLRLDSGGGELLRRYLMPARS
jgi:DNA-binding response OmpR family regulator